jgi:thiamine-phosphate pyrophosphorylase
MPAAEDLASKRRARLARARLYLICDSQPARGDLDGLLRDAIAGGVDVVQLRDKELEARPLLARASLAAAVCRDHGVPFVLNDRPDLALEVGADGVHVGQDDAPVALARRILGPDAVVGLSTHGPADLEGAADQDVTYISAGPVEATPTKPGRPGTGLGYVTEASARSSVPVFVTGGVTPGKIPALRDAGVRHFVVVRYLTQAPDARRAALALRGAIDRALSNEPPRA